MLGFDVVVFRGVGSLAKYIKVVAKVGGFPAKEGRQREARTCCSGTYADWAGGWAKLPTSQAQSRQLVYQNLLSLLQKKKKIYNSHSKHITLTVETAGNRTKKHQHFFGSWTAQSTLVV
jgi:hypothetical protein